MLIRCRRQVNSKRSDPNDTTSLHDRRRLLSQAIQSLSSPQRVYIPGVSALLDSVDPTVTTGAPETVKLWFPSQLPPDSRDRLCVEGLPQLEFQFRLAQAHDALDLIRRLRGVYQALVTKNQIHISSSQGTMTKTKSLFTNFTTKIDQAAARYRDARTALLRLDPGETISQWKANLQELRREDIRGPSREAHETSESQHQMSWIWRTSSLQGDTGINDVDMRAIMRVEWCKASARVERFKEEVELVVEEMRRTLEFFKWTANNWEKLGEARTGEQTMDEDMSAGVRAYAFRKAAHYRMLVEIFLQDWYKCLELKCLGSSWLSKYPRPESCGRRRLRSNVKAYHSSDPSVEEDTNDALVNNPPSDYETDAVDVMSDVELGTDD